MLLCISLSLSARIYAADRDSLCSSVLLVPQGQPPAAGWPAVLLLHDHGARFERGWQKVIGPNPEPYYSGMAIGDSLVAHGYVVYCADALYWGSRRSALSQRQFSDSLGLGNWYARILADDKAGIDTLCSLPFIDTTRIAVAGFSFGAYRAWNLAAEEPRVKACLAAHWMTTLASNRYNDSWLCMYRPIYPLTKDEAVHQFVHHTPYTVHTFAAVAAKVGPRPFLLQYGLRDHLFPTPAVDSCVHYIDSVYRAHEASAAFEVQAYDCKHVFTHEHLLKWLQFLQNAL